MKPLTRRSFIKWVLGSAVAMACPFPGSARERTELDKSNRRRRLTSESNEVCHQVRDGLELPKPAPSRSVDVVIVGAGPAGIAAADALGGGDFLVLEKEPRVGGNAQAESWNGLQYCTGSAWMSFFDKRITRLFKKWKIEALPIKGFDSACFEGKWIRDFWDSRADSPRIDELPYGDAVKRGFRAFLEEVEELDLVADKAKLDALSFFEFLKGKPEPLVRYWDQYGLSNWGASTTDSSAYAGISAARDWPRDRRFTFEGGLGVVPQRVFDGFSPSVRKRFVFESTVYSVRREGKRVLTSFFKDGEAQCVESKAVIFCAPKFIASRVVEGLPAAQRDAMAALRYAPFPVYNLCFDTRVADLGYDSFVVGAKDMTDFVQADWVTRGRKAPAGSPQVLTVYAPMREKERADLLDDEESLARAERAAAELVGSLGSKATSALAEVRIHRRGHAMPMAVPGWHTKMQPAARPDLPPVYFAHSDAFGDVSDLVYAMIAGLEAVQKAVKRL